jgi:hypothetical protein
MKQIDSTDNRHSAASYGHDIGIECSACGRRALLPFDRIAGRGDMSRLIDLKLVCSECGSREWEGFLFAGPLQIDAFRDGADLADVYELRYAHLPRDDPRVIYCSGGPNPYRQVPAGGPTEHEAAARHA